MIKKNIKNIVERNSLLASTYRTIRDELTFKKTKPVRLPMGFHMVGDAGFIKAGKKFYEPAVTKLIQAYLGKSDIFIDIGANIGYYTCIASSMGKHVVAVEPLEQNIKYLLKNLQINKWNNVEVFPLGLSSKPGVTRLFGGSTGASLLAGWAGTSPTYCRTIPVTTLDILLGARFKKNRILIKIDVEGAEYMLLKGASRIFTVRPKPVWVMEICLTEHHPQGINPYFFEIFKMFWNQGYEALSIAEEKKKILVSDVKRWVGKRAIDFGSYNYCFVPM